MKISAKQQPVANYLRSFSAVWVDMGCLKNLRDNCLGDGVGLIVCIKNQLPKLALLLTTYLQGNGGLPLIRWVFDGGEQVAIGVRKLVESSVYEASRLLGRRSYRSMKSEHARKTVISLDIRKTENGITS